MQKSMTIDRSRVISLADKVLSIFIAEKCNEMDMTELISKWNQTYNEQINYTLLSTLPFLKIIKYDAEYDEDDDDNDSEENNSNNTTKPISAHIIVNIEQDDCCNFCRFENCKLIHILSKNEYCSEFEGSQQCSNYQCKLFHRPNIKIIQRLIDCFNHKSSTSLKLSQLIEIHNELFPQFISHCPNPHNIQLRYRSKFYFQPTEDKDDNDFIVEWKGIYESKQFEINKRRQSSPRISFGKKSPDLYSDDSTHSNTSSRRNSNIPRKQPIIPEQTEMYKVYVKLKKEWNDKHLISDLLHLFKKTSKIPIRDMYLPRRNRSGFLSFKNAKDAQSFMYKAVGEKLKCGGRTINVRRWKLSEPSTVRLQIQNIGCCVSFPEFVKWCDINVDGLIFDLQLINNIVTEGADYGILCVDTEKNGQQLINDLDNKQFRDIKLRLTPWIHPDQIKHTKTNRYKPQKNGMRRFSHNGNPRKYKSNSLNASFKSLSTDVDIDFEQRKSKSRLHKRHSLGSMNANLSQTKSPTSPTPSITPSIPPGLNDNHKTGTTKDITFKEWLFEVVKCGQYYDMFIEQGFDCMDDMDPQLITHAVLQEVGVRKIGHRVKILKAIDQFQSLNH